MATFSVIDTVVFSHSSHREGHISGYSPLVTVSVIDTVVFEEKATPMGAHLW